jgi:AraC-like DNA-binding protein
VFQALIGATPAEFVKRLRLERALGLMARSRVPSMTSIALECGFSSSSDFSRCFKQRFDVPPSAFDINFRFPPMVVAEVEIKGGLDLELRALQWLYGTWLPRSGYVPDDHPGFEAWIGRPFAHGTAYFEIRVQLPIRRP